MAVIALEAYQEDGQYQEMLAHFQRGEWREGLMLLNQLIEKYPLEHDLRSLRQEMQLRAAMDSYEKTEISAAKRKRFLTTGLRVLIAAVVIFVVVYGIQASADWLSQQGRRATTLFSQERQTFELNNKYQQAQQLILAYRPKEAILLLQEIQQSDPNYQGLTQSFEDAQSIQGLEDTYQRAMTLKAQGDTRGTLEILQSIPNYRDAQLQIKDIQRSFSMSDLLSAGDQAVKDGNWLEAINQYEQIRKQDPMYLREQVEERLYNSYINAAKSILEEQPDSLEALQQARGYFAEALSVKPQDPKVFEELAVARQTVADRLFKKYLDLAQQALTGQADSLAALRLAQDYFAQAQSIYPNDPTVTQQRQMAANYIQAMVDFNKLNWDSVINRLQPIFDQDPDYAGGTARQALYDAYVARGDNFILNGRAQSALADYQAAVNIAQLRPDALIRLFEAQARVGDVLGIMGNYQTAVYQYRAALEETSIAQSVVLSPDLDRALRNAEANAVRGRYKTAYLQYKDAIRQVVESLQTVTHVVSGEDYLSALANEYNTTVAAILAANKKTDPNQIALGDKIIIPVLPAQTTP